MLDTDDFLLEYSMAFMFSESNNNTDTLDLTTTFLFGTKASLVGGASTSVDSFGVIWHGLCAENKAFWFSSSRSDHFLFFARTVSVVELVCFFSEMLVSAILLETT